jgi:hypothetical protein
MGKFFVYLFVYHGGKFAQGVPECLRHHPTCAKYIKFLVLPPTR